MMRRAISLLQMRRDYHRLRTIAEYEQEPVTRRPRWCRDGIIWRPLDLLENNDFEIERSTSQKNDSPTSSEHKAVEESAPLEKTEVDCSSEEEVLHQQKEMKEKTSTMA